MTPLLSSQTSKRSSEWSDVTCYIWIDAPSSARRTARTSTRPMRSSPMVNQSADPGTTVPCSRSASTRRRRRRTAFGSPLGW